MIISVCTNSNHFSCKTDQKKFRIYWQRMFKNYSKIIFACNHVLHIPIYACSPTLRATVKDYTEQAENPSALLHKKETDTTVRHL